MKQYKVIIRGDKYPMEYYIQSSNWSSATGKAVREWAKTKGKGSRTDTLHIVVSKGIAMTQSEQEGL